ncbi:MAG: hypothetical protein AAF560_10295 [Acidobacteriota bacterium]
MTELNNDFLMRLMRAVDAGLVTHRHYMPWCDAIIEVEDDPPYWMLELTVTENPSQAVTILTQAAHGNFQEVWRPGDYGDFWIGCLFLRYQCREISWATFLRQAGEYADASGAGWECEEFYELLNHYELAEFSRSLEETQAAYFQEKFVEDVEEAASFYEPFEQAFRSARSGET